MATQNMTMMEKFQQVKHKFNKTYLTTLYQLTILAANPENDEETKVHDAVNHAYNKWFPKLQADPFNMDGCELFHDASTEFHDLLLQRDTQLFNAGGDFFSKVYDTVGIDTVALYDGLRDGTEDSDDEDEKETLDADEKDAKANLWDALITQYQLSVIVCLYIRTPLVKSIIDMIIVNNPDLNQDNVFKRIFGDFKKNRRLRRMIMKLLKGDKNKFTQIFNSMQRIISTFSSEVNISKSMNQKVVAARENIARKFAEITLDHELKLSADDLLATLNAVEKNNMEVDAELIQSKVVTQEELNKLRLEYKMRGLDKMDITKVVGNLGKTMEDMFSAIKENDEEKMNALLKKTTQNADIDTADFTKLQEEMKGMEEEMGGMTPEQLMKMEEEDEEEEEEDDELS